MSGSNNPRGHSRLAEEAILQEFRAARKRPGRAVAAGDVHEGRAAGVRRFGLVPLRLVTSTLPLGDPGLLAKSDDRVLRDVETSADIPHWHTDRVETGNVNTLGPGERGKRDLTSQARCHSAGPRRTVSGQIGWQACDQVQQRPPLFQVHISKGH